MVSLSVSVKSVKVHISPETFLALRMSEAAGHRLRRESPGEKSVDPAMDVLLQPASGHLSRKTRSGILLRDSSLGESACIHVAATTRPFPKWTTPE